MLRPFDPSCVLCTAARPLVRALLACVLLLSAAPVSAQITLRGRVTDEVSGRPLADVSIALLRADSTRIANVVTNPTGEFLFNIANPGEYRLQVSHIAYRTLATAPLSLKSREETVVELKLAAAAIPLNALSVVARREDARQDATYEGLYARFRLLPPIGSRRVFLPHDAEMKYSSDARDVLTWTTPSRSCTVVYWNGHLQTSPDLADFRMETPTSQLEGVEYYRTNLEAPFAYREIPAYLQENVFCSVVALWARTDRYLAETTPHYFPPSPPWFPRVSAVVYQVRGHFAPAVGAGIELSSHQALTESVQLGVLIRGTMHELPPDLTQEMTENLSDRRYVLPPGSRTLQLWVAGTDLRLLPIRRDNLTVTTSARLQVAQRSFSLQKPTVRDEAFGVRSFAWGYGFTAGAEARVTPRVTVTAGLGQDWFDFSTYEEIERTFNPTAARWSATALRLGLLYSFARE